MLSDPSNDEQGTEVGIDQGTGEANSLLASLNQLSLSQEDIEQLSRNFAQSQRYEGDMDDNAFDLQGDVFLRSLQLSPAEMDLLEKPTIGDRSEIEEWQVERRKRLPATAFGRVFHMRDHVCRNNLVGNLLSLGPQKPLTHKVTNAIEYVLKNERNAIAEYEKVKEQSVKPCGLFVHPKYAFLSASPDGLIGDEGILLIKCPYFARSTIPYKIPWYMNYFCCYSVKQSELKLKRRHPYYYQIQGMLEITGRKFCDFAIWTRRGIHVERISRDESVWEAMFPQLETFYKLSLLPEIINPRIPRGFPIREPDFVLKAKNALEIRIKNNGNKKIARLNEEARNTNEISGSNNADAEPIDQHYEGDLDDNAFDLKCDEFLSCLQVSPSEIDSLEQRTIGQHKIPEWHAERRKRLTASCFGRVAHMRDDTYRHNFVSKLLSLTRPLPKSVKARNGIKYGLANEENAITEYERVTNQSVKRCGLFVHPKYTYLAGSPDGLIGEDGILEVKCPYSFRRTLPYKIPWYLKAFYCVALQDSTMKLKKGHKYHFQIQGMLEITDRKFCDFVVYTRRGIHVERILRDESFWEEMFPKLERFYKLSLLPEIINPRIARGFPIKEPVFVVEAKNRANMRRRNQQ